MGFIGVIDSGVGGLTILNKLQQTYPYNFCYIADHAFCPYGTKSNEEIFDRTSKLVQFLQACGAQAVVLACNTMSAFTAKLQQIWNVPIFDVIVPTCQFVTSNSLIKKVALLATRSTILNGRYQSYLSLQGIELVCYDCSAFVPYVEHCELTSLECRNSVRKILSSLSQRQVDAVILGCTHFPLLRDQISQYCSNDKIVECCCYLPDNICEESSQPFVTYLTTGNVNCANNAAKWCDGVQYVHVDM